MHDRDADTSPEGVPRSRPPFSRRALVAAGLVAGAAGVTTAVTNRFRRNPPNDAQPADQALRNPGADQPGRLQARPAVPDLPPPSPGLHPVGLRESGRDALLLVPATYEAGVAAPLAVALHGAGGDATGGLAPLRDLADAAGLVVLSPASSRPTWDVIVDEFGLDVAFIDRALRHVFTRMSIDARRIAITGFSDGASYALSLGLGNGDLFTHCIAFSPGFVAEPARIGRPRLFVTHGVHDTVLPIDRCSRRIVPTLRSSGYDVDYREFDGGHVIPPDLARASISWLNQPL